MLLAHLASDDALDAAYTWLCKRRRNYPADADFWSFRRHWEVEKKRIQSDLLAGTFRFGLLDRITLANGNDIDLWSTRDALAVNEMLGSLRLEKHPDKTFIGKVDRRFDFLGYHFSREGLTVAAATIRKFVDHARRLYEQEREAPKVASRLGAYVRRWYGWSRGGLGNLPAQCR